MWNSVGQKQISVSGKPLSVFFQNSIDSGTVPVQWKQAIVTPIFKKGDKHNPANYRPISLTAICCKLLEHIVSKALLSLLEANEILIDSQRGFRRSRSCETQLVLFVDELVRSLHAGKQIDAVVMDFSKAFDVVPHNSLLVKLSCYGIQKQNLGLYSVIHIWACICDLWGAPWLNPLTHPISRFFNDIPEQISSTCHLFADDTIVYREINSVDDTAQLQKDLAALECWEKRWGMSFNPTKCKNQYHNEKEAQCCSVLPERGAPGKCPGGLIPRCSDCRQPHLA